MNQKELRKDLLKIAKLLQVTAEKYGDIYLTATHCENSDRSWVTYEHEGKYTDVNYYSKKKAPVAEQEQKN